MQLTEKHIFFLDNVEIDTEFQSEQIRHDTSNILCKHYCGGYHIDTKSEFIELKGLDVKNIREEYDDDIEEFVTTYPCNVCEFTFNDLDKLKHYVKGDH